LPPPLPPPLPPAPLAYWLQVSRGWHTNGWSGAGAAAFVPVSCAAACRCKPGVGPCPCSATFNGLTPGCRQFLSIRPERDSWGTTASLSSLSINGVTVPSQYFPCFPGATQSVRGVARPVPPCLRLECLAGSVSAACRCACARPLVFGFSRAVRLLPRVHTHVVRRGQLLDVGHRDGGAVGGQRQECRHLRVQQRRERAGLGLASMRGLLGLMGEEYGATRREEVFLQLTAMTSLTFAERGVQCCLESCSSPNPALSRAPLLCCRP
jgi:hypothetical protein